MLASPTSNVFKAVEAAIPFSKFPNTYLPAPAPVTVAAFASVSLLAPVVINPEVKVTLMFTVAFAPSVMPPDLLITRLPSTVVVDGTSKPVVTLVVPT